MKKKFVFYMMATALAMSVAGCGDCGDKEEEIPFWDESYPEEIWKELVDVPAYVDTMDMFTDGAYTRIFLYKYLLYNMVSLDAVSYNADSLDADIRSKDYSTISVIFVETAELRRHKIPLHSKVYITASVTNRCVKNSYYTGHSVPDTEWGDYLPCKTYLHKIRIRK